MREVAVDQNQLVPRRQESLIRFPGKITIWGRGAFYWLVPFAICLDAAKHYSWGFHTSSMFNLTLLGVILTIRSLPLHLLHSMFFALLFAQLILFQDLISHCPFRYGLILAGSSIFISLEIKAPATVVSLLQYKWRLCVHRGVFYFPPGGKRRFYTRSDLIPVCSSL